MPDWGIFTLPLIGATGVLLLAFFTADDLAIEEIRVPPTLEWNGYPDAVVREKLTDSLREINDEALELELGIEVDPNRFDASISKFEEYLGLNALVTGMRDMAGSIKYYVNGEISEKQGRLVFTARVFVEDVDKAVHLVEAEGNLDDIDGMLKDAALRILEVIDPYIVALHYHEEELTAGQYGFERTREKLEIFLKTPPPENNYLGYDLIGEMHLERAQCDAALTDKERAAEREQALTWLGYALNSRPDYFLTNLHVAEAFLQKGQFDLADRYFVRAVELNPDNWPVRERWGRALMAQGRVREAIFQYVAAVELNPRSPQLRNALADLYFKAGNPEAADAQQEKALLIDPESVYPNVTFSAKREQTARCDQ